LDPTDLINTISVTTGQKPVLKKTKNLYLSLDKYEPFLKKWLLEDKKGKWKPNTYGQSKSWIDAGLHPRSMTRDGKWGVPVPLDEYKDNILYVWFDAPIGYISATKQWAIDNQKSWEPYWKDKDTKLVHFVGKDNIVFHCIIFPIMLEMHGEYILPEDVPANEFLNLEGQKMSTSRNWSLEMYEYLQDFPDNIDELRYCLISNMPENKDSDFSWKDFQTKNNSELVNNAGNFINRVFVLLHKYYNGVVPQAKGCSELEFFVKNQKEKITTAIENYKFREALFEVMQVTDRGNKLLTEKEPWKLYKTDPEATAIVLYDCLQLIANWTLLIEPFLPNTSKLMLEKLNIKVAKIRIGIVLAKMGGALQEMVKPIKLGLGAAFGSGKHYQSWIHIQDLVAIFQFVIQNELSGVFNGVAPYPVTNAELTKAIAKTLGKPLFLPNIPKFVMKIILGEMHQILFSSQHVSCRKLLDLKYQFQFASIDKALHNLLK
jgi:methionyl-tRNA synthetase